MFDQEDDACPCEQCTAPEPAGLPSIPPRQPRPIPQGNELGTSRTAQAGA